MKKYLLVMIATAILIMTVLAGNIFAFLYTIEGQLEVPVYLPDVMVKSVCIGLTPPPKLPNMGVEVEPGRIVKCPLDLKRQGLETLVLYESLTMRLYLTPGSYLIEAGKLIIYTYSEINVVVFVEEGLDDYKSSIILETPKGVLEIPLVTKSSATLNIDEGYSEIGLYIKIRVLQAGEDSFRLAFYISPS